ncbi:hypothetical protein PR202_gb13135 [Eleusine coracana subsp. coracana]|uniref:Obtusifoliol 14-alpha demethylase n=1 Tax=Eleusine coracana subsp. coracana TaxID=191504 RepID=A0AAV5ET05_ELECO|nr:hypothetical protein PR202_gb13135 [Eleusine coracana subsp. coracana]
MTNFAIWFAIALAFVAVVILRAAPTRTIPDPKGNRLQPPAVTGGSIIGLLHTLCTKGLRAMVRDQYTKLGSVFTVSFVGLKDYFAKWGQQGKVNLKKELDHLLMLISGRCLLGKEVREKMFEEVFMLFYELTDNGMRLSSVLFPYAPLPANRRRDTVRAKLSAIFTEIVRSRKSSGRTEDDVLQNLIDSKYGDGRSTTEAEVIGLIISLLFAGKHTSTIASTWTGAYLLSNPSYLTAAVEEQKQLVRKYSGYLDYGFFHEMDVLHRCIKEALRVHPPVPWFSRKVHKNFTVRTKEGQEYEIPRGHTIVSPVLFNSYLPHIYKDPDVYDPDRFGPGRQEDKAGGKFSYTAFSGGRHACIGESYAYMQIKVIWSHLLRNFELKLETPFPETNWNKIVPEPKGEVTVSYKRRLLPIQ